MAKYAYPAIFTPEEGGLYSVTFPDIPGCYTGGDSITDALEMASDALCLMLYDYEQNGAEIPAASSPRDVQAQAGEDDLVSLIACDTMIYRKLHDNRAVKKTLSIPSWLNDMAERAGINFSGTLQEALKQQLNI